MLILTRRVGESVVIGSDVVLTICSIKGDRTQLGIAAPQSVRIYTEEIFRRIQAEERAAKAAAKINTPPVNGSP
jgi:carbon storage regulator